VDLSGRGRFFSAVIVSAGARAALIDVRTVRLELEGGIVPRSRAFLPVLGDDNQNGIADLEVGFERSTGASLLAG
jgi:hypothetical protein